MHSNHSALKVACVQRLLKWTFGIQIIYGKDGEERKLCFAKEKSFIIYWRYRAIITVLDADQISFRILLSTLRMGGIGVAQ